MLVQQCCMLLQFLAAGNLKVCLLFVKIGRIIFDMA